MKTTLLIASALVVLFFVPTAFSEEQDWSGLYTGVIVGGQFGHSTDRTGAFGYNADDKAWSYDESGFTAGGEANWVISGWAGVAHNPIRPVAIR